MGHVGLAGSLGLLAMIVALDLPDVVRLLIAAPATLAASGYLQAALKFCAGYGARGVFDFGEAGRPTSVRDADAAAADFRTARRVSLASFGIGVALGMLAFLLPI